MQQYTLCNTEKTAECTYHKNIHCSLAKKARRTNFNVALTADIFSTYRRGIKG